MFLGTRSLLRAVSAGRAASAAGPAVAQRRWMSEVAEDGAGWLPETPIRHTTLEEVEEQGIEWTPTGYVKLYVSCFCFCLQHPSAFPFSSTRV